MTQKIAISAPWHNFVSSQLRHMSTIGKNLLSSNTSSACSHNMVNFGPLTAEIGLGVWGTPANFNGFRVLAAILHGTLVVGVSQTAALNRGRHLYLAGRPSRRPLAHISSCCTYFHDTWHTSVGQMIKSHVSNMFHMHENAKSLILKFSKVYSNTLKVWWAT